VPRTRVVPPSAQLLPISTPSPLRRHLSAAFILAPGRSRDPSDLPLLARAPRNLARAIGPRMATPGGEPQNRGPKIFG
jgi:hypothetical protein